MGNQYYIVNQKTIGSPSNGNQYFNTPNSTVPIITGGVITTVGKDTVHTFYALDGTTYQWFTTNIPLDIRYLVVGSGGRAGTISNILWPPRPHDTIFAPGGGGAGGATAGSISIGSGAHEVKVGICEGLYEESTLGLYISPATPSLVIEAYNGGAGDGGTNTTNGAGGFGKTGALYSPTNDGGPENTIINGYGGGGGGAYAGPGTAGKGSINGNGGAGIFSNISGTYQTYCRGGVGGPTAGQPERNDIGLPYGRGGRAQSVDDFIANGPAPVDANKGGDGIVIIRYKTPV